MEAPTDLETARQLDMLWRMVSEGIAKADQVLEKVREVRGEFQTEISRAEAVQSEIAELVQHSRLQVAQLQQLSATVEQLHAVSQLLQQTEGRAQDVLRVQSELQEFHDMVFTLQQIQGQVEEKCHDFDALLQAHSVTQEHRSLEISNLAQQVRADREAIQSVNLEAESLRTADERRVNALETLVHEQREEIERLNKQIRESQAELGQRLQTQAQSQQRLGNWLLGVTFGVALALALAIHASR